MRLANSWTAQLVSLGGVLLLSGCGCHPGCQAGYFCNMYGQCAASSQPGHPSTSSYGMIITTPASGKNCPCDDREYWLSVVGSGSVRATVQTIYSYQETHKTETLLNAYTASLDQPVYLGCDSSETITDRQCGALMKQFSVVSSSIATKLESIGISTAKDKFLDAHFSCSAVCKSNSTDDCEVISGGAAGKDVIQKFNALSSLAKQNPNAVKEEQVTKLFGLDSDPCLRKDTTIKDGIATNEGESCTVHSDFSVSGLPFSAIEISLLIPPSTHAEVRQDFLAIYFNDQTVSPTLTLNNKNLQSLWGGPIKSIEAEPDKMFVLTHGGCIALTGD